MLTLKLYSPKPRPRGGPIPRPKRPSAPHRPRDPSGKSRLQLAAEWLERQLPAGVEIHAGDAIRRAGFAGHSRTTIARARWRVGIVVRRGRGMVNPPWLWRRYTPGSGSKA